MKDLKSFWNSLSPKERIVIVLGLALVGYFLFSHMSSLIKNRSSYGGDYIAGDGQSDTSSGAKNFDSANAPEGGALFMRDPPNNKDCVQAHGQSACVNDDDVARMGRKKGITLFAP